MAMFRQIICSGIVSYSSVNVGIIFAWPSSTYNLFMSNETVLHRPMTETEISLFGSLSSIGALISIPAMGYMLDTLGRKYCTTLCLLSHLLCWTIVAACSQVEVIITAIFLAGLGSSAILVASEICQDNIRGVMSSGTIVSFFIGIFISYVLGFTLSYQTVAYVCLTLTVMNIVTMIFVKESPTFLMMKGFDQEATKSFAFYRSTTIDSMEVMDEMDKLRRVYDVQLDKYDGDITDGECPEGEKLNPKEYTAVEELEHVAEKKTFMKFLRKSRSTRKALFLTLSLVTLTVFQGISILQVYAEPLFEQTMPDVKPFVSVVTFSIVTVFSGFISAYLTDTMGRRNLVIYSSIVSGICCVGLGSQLHVQWAPNWVTALFIYLYTASYTSGAVAPYAVTTEVFLPEVKSVMCMIVYEWGWTCNFVILFIFNPLVSAIGLGPSFYILAIICIATAIYSTIYQPETKGLPIDVIQTLLEKSR